MLKLGSKVIERFTGFQGVITARTEYLNGCIRYAVQSETLTDQSKFPEAEWIDHQQLKVIEPPLEEETKDNNGGPQPKPKNLPNPA